MKWWSLFVILLLFISCAGGRGVKGIQCMKTKPRKVKKYRIKQIKRVYQPVYSASTEPITPISPEEDDTTDLEIITASIEEKETKPEPTIITETVPPQPVEELKENEPNKADANTISQTISTYTKPANNEEQIEEQSPSIKQPIPKPPTKKEESLKENVYITELTTKKTNAQIDDEKPELMLSFRNQEINITKGYSFNEIIPFVINRDELLEPDEAYYQIEDLSALLKENPQVHVTIIANTATDEPHPSHRYGGDEETLTTMKEKEIDSLELNGYIVTLKDLMIARSKRIEKLLIENGVNAEQLDFQLGTHRMWKYQRYVTFVLKEQE